MKDSIASFHGKIDNLSSQESLGKYSSPPILCEGEESSKDTMSTWLQMVDSLQERETGWLFPTRGIFERVPLWDILCFVLFLSGNVFSFHLDQII